MLDFHQGGRRAESHAATWEIQTLGGMTMVMTYPPVNQEFDVENPAFVDSRETIGIPHLCWFTPLGPLGTDYWIFRWTIDGNSPQKWSTISPHLYIDSRWVGMGMGQNFLDFGKHGYWQYLSIFSLNLQWELLQKSHGQSTARRERKQSFGIYVSCIRL